MKFHQQHKGALWDSCKLQMSWDKCTDFQKMTNDLFLSEKYHQAEIMVGKVLSDYILSPVHQVRTLPTKVISTWCCKRKGKKKKIIASPCIWWCWKAIIGRKATQGCADSAMTDSTRVQVPFTEAEGETSVEHEFSLAQLVWKPLAITSSSFCSPCCTARAPFQWIQHHTKLWCWEGLLHLSDEAAFIIAGFSHGTHGQKETSTGLHHQPMQLQTKHLLRCCAWVPKIRPKFLHLL